MDVHTRPGEGARFDILLPRHEDTALWQSPAAVDPAIVTARRPVSRTLLLVEDEPAVRTLAERVLVRAGWQVVSAASAEDALELLEAGGLGGALACVISDVVMPGMDGPALVRVLRRESPGLRRRCWYPAMPMPAYASLCRQRTSVFSPNRLPWQI